jgi:hypothetical protein
MFVIDINSSEQIIVQLSYFKKTFYHDIHFLPKKFKLFFVAVAKKECNLNNSTVANIHESCEFQMKL